MHELVEFLKGFNFQTIISLFAINWYLLRDVKKEVESIHKEFKFINIRLSRVEGTVYGKDIYAPNKDNQ